MLSRCERLTLRLLAIADALGNRWYGWRFNPLYQSGTIVVLLYLTLVATGLWLLLFYRVGSPWESVDRLTADRWLGNWLRGIGCWSVGVTGGLGGSGRGGEREAAGGCQRYQRSLGGAAHRCLS